MKRDLNRRLEALEKESRNAAAASKYDPPNSAPVIQRIRDYLKARGIEQGPMESFAETLARALGITTAELRNQIQGMAYSR
jgi:hypothetical protein